MDGPHSTSAISPRPTERERQLAAMIDTLRAIVLVFDRSGRVCFQNRSAVEACLSQGGRPLAPAELLSAPDGGGTQLARMRAGELPSPFESSWRTCDGAARFVEWTYRRALDAEGDPELIVCTGIDVTERRRSQQEVEQQVRFLQTLIDTVPNPLFYKAVDGYFLGCNQAFEQVTGAPREKMIGKTAYEIVVKPVADRFTAKDRELFEHPDGVLAYESSVPVEGGEYRDIISYKAVFRDLSGRVAGLVGTFLDITERKRAERELARTLDSLETRVQERTAELREEKDRAEAADRIKSEFLNIASHELRTPLTTLRLTIHQLERGLGEGRTLEPRHLTRIDRQLSRLSRMAADLLDVARLEKGALALHRRKLDLRRLIADTVEKFRPIAADRRLETSLPAAPVELWADPDRLRQVLAHLIDNALKYTPPGTPVEVSLEAHTDRVRMSVADRGPFISSEERARLFAPFLRIHSNHHQEGLGLGLYLSRQIVEGHDGEIGLHSDPRRGNTFYLELPRLRPEGL